jgi:hypothetical protein
MVTAEAQNRPGVLVEIIGSRLDLRYGLIDVLKGSVSYCGWKLVRRWRDAWRMACGPKRAPGR